MFAVLRDPILSAMEKLWGVVSRSCRRIKASVIDRVLGKTDVANSKKKRKHPLTWSQRRKKNIMILKEQIRKIKRGVRRGVQSAIDAAHSIKLLKQAITAWQNQRSGSSVKRRTPRDCSESMAKANQQSKRPWMYRNTKHHSRKVYVSPVQRAANKIMDGMSVEFISPRGEAVSKAA